MMKNTLKYILMLFAFNLGYSQDELLKELDSTNLKKEKTIAAFKGMQVVNIQSTKVASRGEWYFLISHRFGNLYEGFQNFFGLDNAYTKIGVLYGIRDGFSVAVSRHTHHKIYELAAKYRIKSQEDNGFPLNITGYHTMDINSMLGTKEFPNLQFSDRLGYSHQIHISRKLSEKTTVQTSGIFVHKNLYSESVEKPNQYLFALGARHKVSKRLSINAEYGFRLNAVERNRFRDPFSIGLDIETGGHVFQVMFSNSQILNDIDYFTYTNGGFNKRIMFFGFNMYRVF